MIAQDQVQAESTFSASLALSDFISLARNYSAQQLFLLQHCEALSCCGKAAELALYYAGGMEVSSQETRKIDLRAWRAVPRISLY